MRIPSALSLAAALVLVSGPSPRADDYADYDYNYGSPDIDQEWEPIPGKDIIPRANVQFAHLRGRIQEKSPDKPELLRYVDVTKEKFVAGAEKTLTAPTYDPLEVWYLGQTVAKVLVPALEGLCDIAAQEDLTPAEADAQKAEVRRQMDVNIQSMKMAAPPSLQVGNEFDPSLLVPADHGRPVKGHAVTDVVATVDDPHRSPSADVTVGALDPSTGAKRKRTEAELREFLDKSPVIQLALQSANEALQPPPVTPVDPKPIPVGGGTPLPKPVNPKPSAPGGPVPAPPPSSSGGGGGQLTPQWVVGNILAGSGSQQMADRGEIQLLLGDYGAATKSARRALSLNPTNKSALAVLHTAQDRITGGKVGEAGREAAFSRAAALGGARGAEPGFSAAAGAAAGVPAGAMSPATKASSDQARAAATTAFKMGDAKGAIEILSKELERNPGNPVLLAMRASAYAGQGQWAKAVADANAGLLLAPGNANLLRVKGLAQVRSKNWRDTLATADEMIRSNPKNPWGWAYRAHALGGLGDKDAMLKSINRAAELDPSFRRAAEQAALLQLPSKEDVLFLFPGESGASSAAPAAASGRGRGRGFGVVVGAGVAAGLLLALGMLSVVLGPLKERAASAFTKSDRAPGSGVAGSPVATAEPASAGGHVAGLIRGPYQIARQIGAGGMGLVFEGTDRSLGRRVAIKKMRDELRLNARERERFIIEAKTVAALHHPNIVDIYAIAEEGDDVYLVFEYVEGKTVHDLIQASGRLKPAETAAAVKAIGDALTFAHAHGVIHRDMKPSNVMIAGGRVKVMDFGIARMAKDALTRYSMTNTVVGTPPYMAPEQEQGVVRKESDAYSLAVCAYEMLTGKLPFIGIGAGMLMNKINMSYIPPSRAIAGLPEELDEVFAKAFQADPDKRYRTPGEFAAALAGAAGGARTGA